MAKTEISWSQYTWNPIAGCLRVSPGCERCYAETMAARIVRMGGYEWKGGEWRDDPKKKHAPGARRAADKYKPLVRINKAGEARWTGKFAFDEEKLAEPLRRKAPTLYFVNSMSDLFGEGLTNEQIAAVFGVMAACPQHTFQVLTKRAARMVEWFAWATRTGHPTELICQNAGDALATEDKAGAAALRGAVIRYSWPLSNVWLGVSCERQREADERIPLLLKCPAVVWWVSAEPLLEQISFRMIGSDGQQAYDALTGHMRHDDGTPIDKVAGPRLDWIVGGGESGHGARPGEIVWLRSLAQQCEQTGVPYFNKQLGAKPVDRGVAVHLNDKKGADPAEWPADLRVREWPRGFAPPKAKKSLPIVKDA